MRCRKLVQIRIGEIWRRWPSKDVDRCGSCKVGSICWGMKPALVVLLLLVVATDARRRHSDAGSSRTNSKAAERDARRREPIAVACGRLREQLQQRTQLGNFTAPGELQFLWPTFENNSAKLLADLPFSLVSQVPGSSPPVSPFYTPVWVSTATGLDTMNAYLLDVVHRMKEADPEGVVLSNIGGWHSSRGFLQPSSALPESHADAVRLLQLHVLEQVGDLVAALRLDSTATPHIAILESWANVNAKLDWNDEHDHATGIFPLVGIYYVDSGMGDAAAPIGVRLTNPRSKPAPKRTTVMKDGRELPLEFPFSLWPTEWAGGAYQLGAAGTLALWPADLKHWVPPHVGDRPRVSVAFNIDVEMVSVEGSQRDI